MHFAQLDNGLTRMSSDGITVAANKGLRKRRTGRVSDLARPSASFGRDRAGTVAVASIGREAVFLASRGDS